jgi:hypothetical protein
MGGHCEWDMLLNTGPLQIHLSSEKTDMVLPFVDMTDINKL